MTVAREVQYERISMYNERQERHSTDPNPRIRPSSLQISSQQLSPTSRMLDLSRPNGLAHALIERRFHVEGQVLTSEMLFAPLVWKGGFRGIESSA